MRAARSVSPMPSARVLPSSRASSSPSSFARAKIVLATLSSTSARTSGEAFAQPGNASVAAWTAWSTSAAPPFGKRATTSSVFDGLRLSSAPSAPVHSPAMKWPRVRVSMVSPLNPVDEAAAGKVPHERGDAHFPRRRVARGGDGVDERAEPAGADRHAVAQLVREAGAGLVPILRRREQSAAEQHESIRIVVLAQGLADEIERVAADLAHVVGAFEAVAHGPVDNEVDVGLAHVVDGETLVEQADERADRARGGVVLGLAEQQGGAAFEIAQVHVVAERGADRFPLRVDHQHDLGLGIVPARIGAHANRCAGPNRGKYRRFREDFGVGADGDFEVLRPHAFGDQRVLERHRLGAARHDGTDAGADLLFERGANLGGARGIAAGALFDHALDGGDGERDATGLDSLEIDRGEQAPASGQPILDSAERLAAGELAPRDG